MSSFSNLFRSNLSNRWRPKNKLENIDVNDIEKVGKAERKYHARLDPESPLGYSGLPPDITKVLEAQGFTKADLNDDLGFALELASMHIEGDVVRMLTSFDKSAKFESARVSSEVEKVIEIVEEDPRRKYVFDEKKSVLGKGSFGRVVKCRSKMTKTDYAMKVIQAKQMKEIKTEIQMHSLCGDHENIVGMIEAFLDKDHVYVVMEIMQLGSLSSYLSQRFKWKEKAIAYVISNALNGIAFMHSHKHLHRDIKSENILVNSKGEVKLADFGFATNLTKDSDFRKTVLGTPHWMAPEITARKPYNNKSDVWSLGITLYDIAHGCPPHSEVKPLKVIFLIKTSPAPTLAEPSEWSREMNDFTARTLDKDPSKRASAAELLNHPFVTQDLCSPHDFVHLLQDIKTLKRKMLEKQKEKNV